MGGRKHGGGGVREGGNTVEEGYGRERTRRRRGT